MRSRICFAILFLFAISLHGFASDPIAGIGPVGNVTKIHGGLEFTEGPTSNGHGVLLFSDIPANRIYRLTNEAQPSVTFEPSYHSNGLMFDGAGILCICEMDGRVTARNLETGKRYLLAGEYEGKRFNACNDLVIDRQGGIYFTDPRYRAPDPWPQGVEAFYYRSPEGEVTRLGSDLAAPNGIILSPDEQHLYVIPSAQKEMMVYPIESPGKLGKGRLFCALQQASEGGNGGGDGLTIDTRGNLYITTGLGLQVYSPAGKLLGIIEVPEHPANVTFAGPDRRTLYVTARTSVYAIPMEVRGHRFSGVVPLPAE